MDEWFDDINEVVAFARWYFGATPVRPSDVIDVFEKPWKWNDEYQAYKQEDDDGTQ